MGSCWLAERCGWCGWCGWCGCCRTRRSSTSHVCFIGDISLSRAVVYPEKLGGGGGGGGVSAQSYLPTRDHQNIFYLIFI